MTARATPRFGGRTVVSLRRCASVVGVLAGVAAFPAAAGAQGLPSCLDLRLGELKLLQLGDCAPPPGTTSTTAPAPAPATTDAAPAPGTAATPAPAADAAAAATGGGGSRWQSSAADAAKRAGDRDAKDREDEIARDAQSKRDAEDRSDGRRTPTARETRPVPAPEPQRDAPGFSEVVPGPAAVGVPNFFIDKFRIPPFLLPIYQAAGMQYGVRWEVLAAINEIETDYGRNLSVSSAGAL
ncbi:MAG: hypothetical protein M0P31_16535, partial [Solirubrobacteraceae bacterium]|nr:hypothetical protein [Solirubrobacteraceae bacterium]